MKSFVCILLLILTGCLANPIVKRLPKTVHVKQNQIFEERVRELAVAGDWVVTRGYDATDVFVANATGIPLSHVGVYDRNNDTIIEAKSGGVRETPLSDLVDNSHRIILIRPRWSTPDTRDKAVENARALIGKSYDLLGIFGLNLPSSYYCSELVVLIYKDWHKPSDRMPTVIAPGELYLYGTILYDSLPREDEAKKED
jgi:uncharacterized protein YycO